MKRLITIMCAALVGVLTLSANAWTSYPGLQQAFGLFGNAQDTAMKSFATTRDGKDPFEDSMIPLEIVPGTIMGDVSTYDSWQNPYTGSVYSWYTAPDTFSNYVMYTYRGEAYLKAGITYNCICNIDDGGILDIADKNIRYSNGNYAFDNGAFKPEADGWYPVIFGSQDNAGGKGPRNHDWNAGLAWTDDDPDGSNNVWHSIRNGEYGVRLRYVADEDQVTVKKVEKTVDGYRFTLSLKNDAVNSTVKVGLSATRVAYGKDDVEPEWTASASASIENAGDTVAIDVPWASEGYPYAVFMASGDDKNAAQYVSASATYNLAQFFGRNMQPGSIEIDVDGVVTSTLTFDAASDDITNTLYVAYGPNDMGDDPADWPVYKRVAVIPGSMTSYTYTFPKEWGSSILALKFFLRDGLYKYEAERIVPSVGAQIDLGFKPDYTMRTRFKAKFCWRAGSGFFHTPDGRYHFTVQHDANSNYVCFYMVEYSNYGGHSDWYNISKYNISLRPYEVEVGDGYMLDPEPSDGSPNAAGCGSASGFDWSQVGNLILYTEGEYGDLYYMTVRTDAEYGNFIHDFIPVVDLDGEAALYDRVTGKFHYNSGTGTLTARGVVATTAGTGEVVDSTDAFTLNDPFVENPPYVTKADDGSFDVHVTLTAGEGDLTMSYNGAYQQLVAEDEKGPKDFSAKITGLAADTTYRYSVNVKGGSIDDNVDGTNTFYTGAIEIASVSAPDAVTLKSGSFTVSRADTANDLVVNLAYGGSAIAGMDYKTLPGSVVIPAGQRAATVVVEPLDGPNRDLERTLSVAIADGLYGISTTAKAIGYTLEKRGNTRGYGFRKFFNVMVGGYAGETALENFPLAVRISEESIDGFSYADVKDPADGGLAFTDLAGNLLDFEVDSWNTNGESIVWVSVPAFEKGTMIRCFYKGTRDFENAPTNVWSKAGYFAVYHMNGEAATGTIVNSVGDFLPAVPTHHQDASGVDVNSFYFDAGPFGVARNNGHNVATGLGNYIQVADPFDDYITEKDGDNRETFSVTGWFKGNLGFGVNFGTARLFSRKSGWNGDYGFELEYNGTINNVLLRGYDTNSGNNLYIPDVSLGWTYVALAFHGGYESAYMNGGAVATDAWFNGATPSEFGLGIGCNAVGAETAFGGAFDEVRLRDAATSTDWIKAEYDSYAADGYLLYGAVVEAAGDGMIIYIR